MRAKKKPRHRWETGAIGACVSVLADVLTENLEEKVRICDRQMRVQLGIEKEEKNEEAA